MSAKRDIAIAAGSAAAGAIATKLAEFAIEEIREWRKRRKETPIPQERSSVAHSPQDGTDSPP